MIFLRSQRVITSGHGSLGWNGKPVKLECPKSSLKETHLYLGVYPELRKIA
jgi:hypothetical protein